jgi:hypothetical protein
MIWINYPKLQLLKLIIFADAIVKLEESIISSNNQIIAPEKSLMLHSENFSVSS